jgi:ribosomal protein S15P/S13E
MDIVEKITASEARPLIDGLLLENTPCNDISAKVAEEFGVLFAPEGIEKYRNRGLNDENAAIRQIVKVTKDLANNEMPATDELSKLSMNFSFQKTNEDLALLYDRIRKLLPHAEANPDDPTFDKRIKEYLAQAEAIRTRVYRHQYEQIRQAVLLSTGKKICTAAISILMPYIHKDFRSEAMRRFQSAIEPLLDMKSVPDMPADIVDVSEERPD